MTEIKMTEINTPKTYPEYALLSQELCRFLDEQKAENIIEINLKGKASFAEGMLIATGRSGRHIKALAEKIKQMLHQSGVTDVSIEGAGTCDWVLIDGGDIIIHLFREDIREYYNLEKMWLKNTQETKAPL